MEQAGDGSRSRETSLPHAVPYVETTLMRDKRVEAEQAYTWARPIVIAIGAVILVWGTWVELTRGLPTTADALEYAGIVLLQLVFITVVWRWPPAGRVLSVSSAGLAIEVKSRRLDLALSDVRSAKASYVSWGTAEDGSPRMKSVFRCLLRLRPGLPYGRVILFDGRQHTIASALRSAGVPVKAEYERVDDEDDEEYSVP